MLKAISTIRNIETTKKKLSFDVFCMSAGTYVTKAFCECGGEYKPNGIMQACNPPNYGHTCDKCKKEMWSKKSYPFTNYEERDMLDNLLGRF